jgi:hypothetical protein
MFGTYLHLNEFKTKFLAYFADRLFPAFLDFMELKEKLQIQDYNIISNERMCERCRGMMLYSLKA